MDPLDDDTPPDLGTLADQVAALQPQNFVTAAAADEGLPVAVVSVAGQATRNRPTIKRGFFDAKPAAKKDVSATSASSKAKTDKGPITLLCAKPDAQKQVPSDFIIEPSEEEQRYMDMRQQLLDRLKPSEQDVAAIASNPVLVGGYDDPEVMAAVNEVAANPAAYNKHAKNPKVRRFYEAMGQMMAGKLQSSDAKPTA